MRTTSSIQFYCRKSKANKAGLSPVEMSIDLNGERRFLNLPLKFSPAEFNKRKPKAEIVDALDAWRTKINQYSTELLNSGIPVTVNSLRNIIQQGGIQNYTITTLFEEYLSILSSRVGKDLSKCVFRKYELVRNLFFKYINPDAQCSTITNAVILKFYAELNAKYDTATSAGYMTKLKTYITFGIDNNRIKINPFQGVKIVRPKKDIDYLTEAQIMALKTATIDNLSLRQVRDCFIVMCGTGLAYSDLKELRKEDIQESDGTYYIKKKRIKNGQEYTSVILPWAMEIINNYDRLPVISNQKTNAYLHTIEGVLNFPHKLYCHLARHSYATLLLNKNVPIATVSKTLGHSSTKITTQFYAKLLDDTIIADVAKAF